MSEWLATLTSFQSVLLMIAVPSTLIFTLQLVMKLVGLSDHDASDMDHHDDSGHDGSFGFMQYLSVGNVSIFLMALSVVAFTASVNGTYGPFALAAGLATGILGVGGNIAAWAALNRLNYTGTTRASDALARTAKVYLTIPPSRNGAGLIHVVAGGSLKEYSAITDDDRPIATGEQVTVVRTNGPTELVVARPIA